MNKEQAAEFLELSVRTLQRHVQRGEIQSTQIKVEKGGQLRLETVFDDEELKRFKANPPDKQARNMTSMTVMTPRNLSRQSQSVTSVTKAAPDAFARLLAAIESQNVGQKILLSLKECRTLTGLSDDNLRDAIHNGKLKAKIIGRGYKVKRDDLDSYIKKL